MKPRRIRTTLLAVAMAGAVPGAVQAVRVDYSIDAGLERDDNVALTAQDQVEQTISRVGFGFELEQESSVVQASMVGRIDHRRYEEEFGNTTDRMFLGRLNWTMLPDRLSLVVEDSYGVQTINRTAPASPDNRQQVNVLAIGPDLQFGTDPSRQGLAELRYIHSNAEVTEQFNSDRVLAALRMVQQLDATRSLSWNLQAQQVDFDDDQFARDHRRYEAFAGYRQVLRHFDMRFDAGYAWLDYDDGESRGTPLFRAELGWSPSERSRFSAALANEFSDAATSALAGVGEATGVPTSVATGTATINAYAYELQSVVVDYTYTGPRLSASVNTSAQRLDYVDQAGANEKGRGVGAALRYRLRPDLALSASAGINRTEFSAPEDRLETDRRFSLSLDKQWSRHWRSILGVSRYERDTRSAPDAFEQNVIYLNLIYSNR